MAGNKDHFRIGQRLPGAGQNLHAIDVVHHQIGDDDVERIGFDLPRAFGAARGDNALIADLRQALFHGPRQRLVVIDDQHANRRRPWLSSFHGASNFLHEGDDSELEQKRREAD